MSDLVKFVKADGETVVEINTEPATLEAALSLGWRPVEEKGSGAANGDSGTGSQGGDGKKDEPNATGGAIDLAKEKGIDLALVTGSGDDGRIDKADVKKYIDEKGGD